MHLSNRGRLVGSGAVAMLAAAVLAGACGSSNKTTTAALAFARFPGTASARLRNIDLDDRGTDCFGGADYRLRVSVEQRCICERPLL